MPSNLRTLAMMLGSRSVWGIGTHNYVAAIEGKHQIGGSNLGQDGGHGGCSIILPARRGHPWRVAGLAAEDVRTPQENAMRLTCLPPETKGLAAPLNALLQRLRLAGPAVRHLNELAALGLDQLPHVVALALQLKPLGLLVHTTLLAEPPLQAQRGLRRNFAPLGWISRSPFTCRQTTFINNSPND